MQFFGIFIKKVLLLVLIGQQVHTVENYSYYLINVS